MDIKRRARPIATVITLDAKIQVDSKPPYVS